MPVSFGQRWAGGSATVVSIVANVPTTPPLPWLAVTTTEPPGYSTKLPLSGQLPVDLFADAVDGLDVVDHLPHHCGVGRRGSQFYLAGLRSHSGEEVAGATGSAATNSTPSEGWS